jgi:hypothetical protein
MIGEKTWFVAVVAGAAFFACGVEDRTLENPDAGAGRAGTGVDGGGTTGSSGTTGSGGSGASDAQPDVNGCGGGRLDCNGDQVCDVDGQGDPDNCGACGRRCSSTGVQTRACVAGRCQPVCQTDFGDCASPAGADDGCETGLVNSTAHCGRCGRDCQGGLCNASKCEVLTLGDDDLAAEQVAVDATHVYWVQARQHGRVRRSPKTGGGASEFGTAQLPSDVATDGTTVFWVDGGELGENYVSARVLRRPADLSAAQTAIYTVPMDQIRGLNSIGLDATHVYVTDVFGSTILRIAHDGSSMNTLTADASNPLLMEVDSGYAYFQGAMESPVGRLATNSTTDVPVFITPATTECFAVYSGFVYYGISTGIFRVQVTGGSPSQLAAAPGRPVTAIAADASGVYYALDPSALYRIPLAGGGTPEPLFTREGGYTSDIALDAGAIYWTDRGGGPLSLRGAVYKLAK